MKQLHVVHGYDTLAWATYMAEEIGHGIVGRGAGDLQANLAEEPAALTLDTVECKYQERREIVIGRLDVVSRFISKSSNRRYMVKGLF